MMVHETFRMFFFLLQKLFYYRTVPYNTLRYSQRILVSNTKFIFFYITLSLSVLST